MVKNLLYIVVLSSFVIGCASTPKEDVVQDNSSYTKSLDEKTELIAEVEPPINETAKVVEEKISTTITKENKPTTKDASKTTPTKVVEQKKVEERKTAPTNNTKPTTKYTPPKKEEKLSTDLIFNDKTASPTKKTEPDVPRPILTFDYKEYDFGIVDEGDTVIHKFYFTNTGRAPAIISEATSSCGCTIPEYPKQPIKPGQRAYIKALFDTKSRLNRQKKSITIKANTQPNWTTLYLRGDVYNRPKKKEEEKDKEEKKTTTKPSASQDAKQPNKVEEKKGEEVKNETATSNAKVITNKEDEDKKTLEIQPPSVTNKVEIEKKKGFQLPSLGKKKKKE